MINPLVYEIGPLVIVSGVFGVTYLQMRNSRLKKEETLLELKNH